jgi:hypothetical protein
MNTCLSCRDKQVSLWDIDIYRIAKHQHWRPNVAGKCVAFLFRTVEIQRSNLKQETISAKVLRVFSQSF